MKLVPFYEPVFIAGHTEPANRRTKQYGRYRYLALLPFAFLVACTTQGPIRQQANLPSAMPTAPVTVSEQNEPPTAVQSGNEPDTKETASPEKIATLRSWVDLQNRLYSVAAPMLIKNARLCNKKVYYLLGMTAKTKYSYSTEFIPAAASGLGLGERLRVMHVLPGSGAAQSGVKLGDILLAADGESLPQGPGAEKKAGKLLSAKIRGQSSVNLVVMRDGGRLLLKVPLTNACAFRIELGNADYVNSYADGIRIMITRGMLNFVRTDEELAYVLAKEIAHNMLTKSARPPMETVIDRLQLFGTKNISPAAPVRLVPYTPVLDSTADKLSLYLIARAGYDIDNALAFWQRLATQYPSEIQNSHTALHPSTAYRLSVMRQMVHTIKLKQKNNLPLVPERNTY